MTTKVLDTVILWVSSCESVVVIVRDTPLEALRHPTLKHTREWYDILASMSQVWDGHTHSSPHHMNCIWVDTTFRTCGLQTHNRSDFDLSGRRFLHPHVLLGMTMISRPRSVTERCGAGGSAPMKLPTGRVCHREHMNMSEWYLLWKNVE
jgi:hypothetical protein